ncbi:VOC family protein [Pseudokineococcus sp. 1T1Z-3]|uniref:VOC family protein n=1 Tax=Pseudokineococcus sp. 1T1Z-3 TaxID=3132745 RepID=UPI003096B9CD
MGRSDRRTITTTLWFDGRTEEAAELYVSVFAGSRVVEVSRYPDGFVDPGSGADRSGAVATVELEVAGTPLVLLDGGPAFPQTPAVSLSVACADQAEVDRVWTALLDGGGQESRCGWLTDRFGVSWQVVPDALEELRTAADPGRASRAFQAMLGMGKIDVAELYRAADG